MRATYEDLLRAARRAAVEAHEVRHRDMVGLLDGWQSVLVATRGHIRWLRGDLELTKVLHLPAGKGDDDLVRLARLIGAGADLLATQDAYNASALDHSANLVAARAEVAEIAEIAGTAVLRDLTVPKYRPIGRRVHRMMVRLHRISRLGGASDELGGLRNLTTSRPQFGTDPFSLLAWTAARWERAHQEVDSRSLLTRDLRSCTSQLRTVCGYAWHIAGWVSAEAGGVGLDARSLVDVGRLRDALRAFDAGAARVSRSWQRRVSDMGGQSGTPAEVAFLDLKSAFDALFRPEDHLLPAQGLIPNRRHAMAALDALDELVDAAVRVARLQQFAVDDLIRTGSLFMPTRDLASSSLPSYSRRVLRTGSRSRWMRTGIAMYFTELTDSLVESATHLSTAAEVARGLSGTTHQRRPFGDRDARMPPPLAMQSRLVAEGTGFPDQGPEAAWPCR